MLTTFLDNRRGSRDAVAARLAGGGVHLHRFHRVGEDPFSAASLYRCRCGMVRSGM